MIKIRHIKNYERKMCYNKVEYITTAGVYCTTQDDKSIFCMPEFSGSKIFNHCFHVDNDKGESGKGYDMIIDRDLMVQLDLTAKFKQQVLQWDGDNVHMKESIKFIG